MVLFYKNNKTSLRQKVGSSSGLFSASMNTHIVIIYPALSIKTSQQVEIE